jgi:Clostripain family
MKRRQFCHHGVLGTICLTGIVENSNAAVFISRYSQSKSYHRWVILYWMPYDNNLSRFGEPIIEMLVNGTKKSEAVVIVQSDYAGDRKMRRRHIAGGIIKEIAIAEEDSSDISVFSAYLDWAHQTFDAEHWAVIVVGHGGQLNEISPDDHSSNLLGERTWMKVDRFATAVSKFNKSTGEKVDLLFFQNCNKATLEVVYETRNCARYTLASQLELGAPNYYYPGFFQHLHQSSFGGRAAAIAIMKSESVRMYHSLTLIDNRLLKNIPAKLARVIQPLLHRQSHSTDLSSLLTIHYFDEQYCDLLMLFGYLSKNINPAHQEFSKFSEFLQSSVITAHQTGGKLLENNYINTEKLCGLSLYLPEDIQSISRHQSLALYQETDLFKLYRKILGG